MQAPFAGCCSSSAGSLSETRLQPEQSPLSAAATAGDTAGRNPASPVGSLQRLAGPE